jgi:hypothetical protein
MTHLEPPKNYSQTHIKQNSRLETGNLILILEVIMLVH